MKTKIFEINTHLPQARMINESADVLRKGGLVVFPTETVYGVGANSLDKEAVEKLYKIKKRPKGKPFTIHIAKFSSLKELNIELSEHANNIIHKFWPGPLTIIAFNDKKEKIGLRMPKNKIALEIIKKSEVPLSVPSANISGNKPPVSGEEAIAEMEGSVDIILNGGLTEKGLESTILDVTTEPFKIIRKGAIGSEDLLADYHLLFVCTGNSCRSVMADYFMKTFLKEAGLSEKIIVSSAGTGTYEGMTASTNTIEVMKQEDIDVTDHIGKPVTGEMLKKADFVFVMEDIHREIILSRLPGYELKIRLLRENKNIPDPIGRSLDEYKKTRDIIKSEIENIFLELFKKEKDK